MGLFLRYLENMLQLILQVLLLHLFFIHDSAPSIFLVFRVERSLGSLVRGAKVPEGILAAWQAIRRAI